MQKKILFSVVFLTVTFVSYITFRYMRTPVATSPVVTAEYQLSRESEEPSVILVDLLPEGARPDVVTLIVGGALQFNTKDGKRHILSQGEGDQFGHGHGHAGAGSLDSAEFGAGEAYRVQITKKGTYFFHDHLNPEIGVTVIVYEPEVNT